MRLLRAAILSGLGALAAITATRLVRDPTRACVRCGRNPRLGDRSCRHCAATGTEGTPPASERTAVEGWSSDVLDEDGFVVIDREIGTGWDYVPEWMDPHSIARRLHRRIRGGENS